MTNIFSIIGNTGKLTLLALLFAVFLQIGVGSNASAASVYDDVVHVADELLMTDIAGVEPDENISIDWLTQALESLEKQCDNRSAGSAKTDRCNTETGLRNALQSDNGHWLVTYNATTKNNITIYFSDDITAELQFQTNPPQLPELRYITTTSNITRFDLSFSSTTNANYISDKGFNAGSSTNSMSFGIVQEGNPTEIFLATLPVTYPPGYEGEIIPDSYTPPGAPHYEAGIGFSPQFSYDVVDLNIILQDTTNPSKIDEYAIDLCMFQVPNNKYGDNFTEYYYDCSMNPPVSHTFSDGYGSYNIIQRMHSSETDLWYETTRVLKIDGSSFSGTVGDEAISNSIGDILGKFNFPLYGLQQIMLVPLEFFASLPNKIDNCIPWTLPLFDQTFQMGCLSGYIKDWNSNLVLIYQTALTGFSTYYVALMFMARIKDTVNPADDSIEVVKL